MHCMVFKVCVMYQSNPRTPIPLSGIPRAFDERLAPYGGEFYVKRSPPGRAFDYRENVGHRQQAEGLLTWKRLKQHDSEKGNETINVTWCLCLCEKKKHINREFAWICCHNSYICLNALWIGYYGTIHDYCILVELESAFLSYTDRKVFTSAFSPFCCRLSFTFEFSARNSCNWLCILTQSLQLKARNS